LSKWLIQHKRIEIDGYCGIGWQANALWRSRIYRRDESRHTCSPLAGAIAPTEATWAALMVLYTACLRYGVPDTLVSDRGGAYTSNDFEAVCTRPQVRHETIVTIQGESYRNLMETHFNIQRRLYDDQFSLARTPAAL
jgi:transposase InsO family protein